jgi:hypothetical protein
MADQFSLGMLDVLEDGIEDGFDDGFDDGFRKL